MSLLYIILIALSLAMDAFAVSISIGLSCNKKYTSTALKAGISFGVFQGGMATIGWALGASLKNIIEPIDHWIAFLLLLAIGINLIKESRDTICKSLSIDNFRVLLTLSIATSIDALATGVTFSLLNVNILTAGLLIGLITYFTSIFGVYIGNKLSCQAKLQSFVNLIGGLILIGIGCKILITHIVQHI